jgi:hypothetical protein
LPPGAWPARTERDGIAADSILPGAEQPEALIAQLDTPNPTPDVRQPWSFEHAPEKTRSQRGDGRSFVDYALAPLPRFAVQFWQCVGDSSVSQRLHSARDLPPCWCSSLPDKSWARPDNRMTR